MTRWQTAKVRGWTEPVNPNKQSDFAVKKSNPSGDKPKQVHRDFRRAPGVVLYFDTETTIDIYQNLKIGAYLFCWCDDDMDMWAFEEGLFYDDDLPKTDPVGFKTLVDYVEKGKRVRYYRHQVEGSIPGAPGWWVKFDYGNNSVYSSRVNVAQITQARFELGMPRRPNDNLELMSASQFVNDKLYETCFPTKLWHGEGKPATLVGANLPFDLSRLARYVRSSDPKWYRGGFSLKLLPGEIKAGHLVEPLKHDGNIQLARRGAFGNRIGFAHKHERERDYFTDVLNLGWALTNHRFNLDTLSRTFNPYDGNHVKSHAPAYGEITEEFITYMRDDVLATMASHAGLLREVNRHTTYYDETRSYSPAALPKAYYRAMGITPILTRQPDYPREILGHAMTTFYGGRAECHIRKAIVPVAYLDFTSMYPTVDSLMDLWQFLVCERTQHRIETSQVRSLLKQANLFEMLFDQAAWPQLRGIALIRPDGDLLPIRTRLGGTNSTIALAYITSKEPMWYSIPDLVNSVIITGKIPDIIKAYRFYPAGMRLKKLRKVKLRGEVEINPNTQDFFRVAMEQRQAIKIANNNCKCGECETCRLSDSLKVTANSGAYGLFAEFNQEPHNGKIDVYGIDPTPVRSDIERIDLPGEFAFPPIATLITSGARLMLGMLERLVTNAGGTWAFCDTDSMAIVASATGQTVHTRHGNIPALSEVKVREIQERFDSLNPYDPTVAPGIHILKREYDKDPRQLYAYTIAAKRYALFRFSDDNITVERSEDIGDVDVIPGEGRKEHGLGGFMSPINPDEESERGKRQYITEIWRYLISQELGIPTEEPSFFDSPAMMRLTLTTWDSLNNFSRFNEGKPWSKQIKPYNFVTSPVPGGTAIERIIHGGANGNRLRLIAPYNRDPIQQISAEYVNINNPHDEPYHVTTNRNPDDLALILTDPHTVTIMSWRDVVTEFARHPEPKYADTNGKTCDYETRGILYRHHINIGRIEYIGKESNRLSTTEEVLARPGDLDIANYGTGRDDVRELVVPVLQASRDLRSRKTSETWHGLSTPALASTAKGPGREQVREYLTMPNLTTVSDTVWTNVAMPLIKLAVRRAIKELPEDSIDRSWRILRNAYANWIDVLLTWKNTR
jgi:hypothetical protein